MSVGKSLPIGETLAIMWAASQEPGELHVKELLSAEFSFHFCGTVHEISCCAQVADCPPAMAADCSAVGCGGCASSPAFEPEEGEPVRPDPPPVSPTPTGSPAPSLAQR